jgi:hypothetical protein
MGTLDPLYARVLVLECGEKRLAIVALDYGRTFGPPSLEHLRESVKKSSGISYLIVAASHTHSGPAILDECPSNSTPAWEMTALEKVTKAIDAAHHSAMEARLGTRSGVCYIAHNRHHVNPDGTVTIMWRNPSRAMTTPLDPNNIGEAQLEHDCLADSLRITSGRMVAIRERFFSPTTASPITCESRPDARGRRSAELA